MLPTLKQLSKDNKQQFLDDKNASKGDNKQLLLEDKNNKVLLLEDKNNKVLLLEDKNASNFCPTFGGKSKGDNKQLLLEDKNNKVLLLEDKNASKDNKVLLLEDKNNKVLLLEDKNVSNFCPTFGGKSKGDNKQLLLDDKNASKDDKRASNFCPTFGGKSKGDNKQLSKDNKQLSKDNKQLSKDNKQLSKDNKQLSKDNKQLSKDDKRASKSKESDLSPSVTKKKKRYRFLSFAQLKYLIANDLRAKDRLAEEEMCYPIALCPIPGLFKIKLKPWAAFHSVSRWLKSKALEKTKINGLGHKKTADLLIKKTKGEAQQVVKPLIKGGKQRKYDTRQLDTRKSDTRQFDTRKSDTRQFDTRKSNRKKRSLLDQLKEKNNNLPQLRRARAFKWRSTNVPSKILDLNQTGLHCVLHIRRTKNNMHCSIANLFGDSKTIWSIRGGQIQPHGSKGKRKTRYSQRMIFKAMTQKLRELGFKYLVIHVKGPTNNKRYIFKNFFKQFRITLIRDLTNVPHNGCRAPKARRV